MSLAVIGRSPLIQPAAFAAGGILAIAAECRRRRALGEVIIDLSLGEPDMETPAHIGRAAVAAIGEGQTRYTPPAGLAPLRQAAMRLLGSEGLRYGPRQVIVTHGATGALASAFHALLGAGDEVLIPSPHYPQYMNAIQLASGHAVTIPTTIEEGFRLDPDRLRRALTPRSRLLILNTPSNPAGVVYSRGELQAIAEIVVERGLVVISDEVYAAFTPGFLSIAALDEEMLERTLVVRSLSKTYAMTGWRVGFAAGPARWIESMTAVQEATIVAPSSIAQWAALEALRGPQDCVCVLASEMASRRALATARLQAIDGVRMPATEAGMFVFPDLGLSEPDVTTFCARLLAERGVAVVPGREFGAGSCVRISLAASAGLLTEGIGRLAECIVATREGRWTSV
ncbi:MAG: aminotransferase class [Acidobacteria bacterium]|nr:aminotransferase class [Acidobacteriota bacterium]